MYLFKKSQTNWKYILIVIILAVIVGGGILGYWQIINQELTFVEFPQVKEAKEIEFSDEIIIRILTEILPADYEKDFTDYRKEENLDKDEGQEIRIAGIKSDGTAPAHFVSPTILYIDDLNNDGNPEIILTAIPFERAGQAYLAIITILDNNGDYKKIVDFDFNEIIKKEYYLTFGNTPGIKMVKDINNDGLIEMQLSWWTGAARPFTTDAFLVLDWFRQKITWLKLINEDGNAVPAIFDTGWGGGSGGFWVGSVHTIDINKDEKLEICDVNQEQVGLGLESKLGWETKVYEWNGSIFSYNKELSISSGMADEMPEMPEWLKNVAPSFEEPWE